MDREKVAYCAANRIFGFRPALGLHMIEYAGGAAALFDADKEKLRMAAGEFGIHVYELNARALEQAEKELERTERDGARFVTIADADYPAMLRECCDDPPLGLYVKGVSSPDEIFASRPAVAIVGTRDMSMYGKEWTKRIVECLAGAKTKPLIISGLAYGIDITAHRAAFDAGLPTAAVMATGIDSTYPCRHSGMADRIARTPGCALVTDYPEGTMPLAPHFLRRNRIIAGLSMAVILVESRVKGGGMMTARLAYSYNRDVYAVPGRLEDARSQGCNFLIREKTAEAIFSPEDLVKELGLGDAGGRGRRKRELAAVARQKYGESGGGFGADEVVSVARAVECGERPDAAAVAQTTGLPYWTVSGILEMFLYDGLVDMDLLGHCSPA